MESFRIVNLCGSAGALSAYLEILRLIPADSGMSFVVLAHRRSNTTHVLAEILSQSLVIPVKEVVEGTTILPNHVYVMPAAQDMTTDGDSFFLSPMKTIYGWPNVFDTYLESIAQWTHDRAVTVILSGMDKDGSAHLEALRQGGGVNYAQTDADTPSMPKNAMRTGMVDYAGSPQEIAAAILKLPALSDSLAHSSAPLCSAC